MRENLPVTSNEYILNSGMKIVSTADLQGDIVYANPYLIDVSGYSREELTGAPHSLLRHPDTPSAVFIHMWRCLHAGQAWSGMLKNRRKTGEFYWVLANITPLVEGGKVVGYMSVRTRPSRDQVAEAERAYQAMRDEAAAVSALHSRATSGKRGGRQRATAV